MKTILLLGDDSPGFHPCYQTALKLAQAFAGAIRVLSITSYDRYTSLDPWGGAYVLPALLERAEEFEARRAAAIAERFAQDHVGFDYEHAYGDAAELVVSRSRLADAVIVPRPVAHPSERRPELPFIADVAIDAEAPVLAIPPEGPPLDPTGPALIAWNGTAEAAAALKAAVPLLAKASAITLLTAGAIGMEYPANDASAYLARRGITAAIRVCAAEDRPVDQALLAEAEARGAAYIVMGAYGHSRARQWLLGGVSRAMLQTSPLPLVLAH